MAYLKQQYTVVAIALACLVVLLGFLAFVLNVQNKWVPVAFLTGGFFSALSGYLGMKTATYASSRTANAARSSLNSSDHCFQKRGSHGPDRGRAGSS